MRPFDDELRDALQRKDPPPGLEARVLARIRAEQARQTQRPRWRAFAALAATLAVVAGGLEYRRYEEGMRAKQELMLALGIAGNKLHGAQKKVFELNQRTIHE